MIRLLLVLLALATPGQAETARVLSGEHADFTRLVIELPEASAWRVGRTAMGYAFATDDDRQPVFDLSSVWKRIPRTRLQALRADPTTGALTLTLACACHILPFEYRPGTIVLDIRNGPAPDGSAFESPFSLAQVEKSVPRAAETPVIYDWRAGLPKASVAEDPLPLASGGASLSPLRDALLAEISLAAAEGLVDMRLPATNDTADGDPPKVPDWAHVSLGSLPGVDLSVGEPEATPDKACPSDDLLALPDWGEARPPLDLLAEARDGLYGEFDTLSPDGVLRAVRLHLYLGFGAEARQYGLLLPEAERPEDLAMLLSLAPLVDGAADPASDLARMLDCDNAAALWAALAHRDLSSAGTVNVDAVVRSFLALPSHLRRHLGPRLTDLLLPVDETAARTVRDAMARTPDVAPGAVALADAQADLHAGRLEAARRNAEAALEAGTPSIGALVAVVESHAASLTPMAPEIVETVLAWQGAAEGGFDSARVQRAAILGLALSGQADAAFAKAGPSGPEMADLWRVAVALADDNAFLSHAVQPPRVDLPPVDDDVAMAIAARLLALGFPDAGLGWLAPVGVSSPPEVRLIAAEAELRRGDARQALTLVTGLQDEAAVGLRLRAETALGALEAAQRSAEAAGLTDEATRLALWRSDWTGLAASEPSPVAEAAGYASALTPATSGTLARGAALLENSARARAAVEALLSSVAPVQP